MTTATYHRPEAHDHGKRHTCPCCLRSIKTTKGGRMARHGWRETGRRKGSYGMGWQFGSCNGSGATPIEISDGDALRFAQGALDEAQAAEARALERPETLPQQVHFSISIRKPADLDDPHRTGVAAAREQGVTFEAREGRYHFAMDVTATVPQGFEGLTSYGQPLREGGRGAWVKSYEELHADRAKKLNTYAQAMRELAAAIDARCAEERAKGALLEDAAPEPQPAPAEAPAPAPAPKKARATGGDAEAAVLEAMRGGAQKASEVAKALETTRNAAWGAMNRLLKKGLIERTGRGTYGVAG